MPEPQQKPPLDTHALLVAITAAVAAGVAFMILLKWDLFPAIIGGFSIGVIWWSINQAFNRSS
jgi:Na+-transporting NADH:ubiquinone oxidoreductase subunit NqrE